MLLILRSTERCTANYQGLCRNLHKLPTLAHLAGQVQQSKLQSVLLQASIRLASGIYHSSCTLPAKVTSCDVHSVVSFMMQLIMMLTPIRDNAMHCQPPNRRMHHLLPVFWQSITCRNGTLSSASSTMRCSGPRTDLGRPVTFWAFPLQA